MKETPSGIPGDCQDCVPVAGLATTEHLENLRIVLKRLLEEEEKISSKSYPRPRYCTLKFLFFYFLDHRLILGASATSRGRREHFFLNSRILGHMYRSSGHL